MLFELNKVSLILLHLFIILLAGFLMIRLTQKLKLPDVSGYIFVGILIGPYGLNILNMTTIYNMDFLGDIALGFISFDVGKFLRYDLFKKSGTKSIVITLFESLLTGLFISLVMFYIFKLDLSFSLLLGLTALCSIFDVSPLLAAMVFGSVYMNSTNYIELFNQVTEFTPPIFTLFFIISGMKLDIGALTTLGMVGVTYFLVRIIGKYIGAFIGAYVVNNYYTCFLSPLRTNRTNICKACSYLFWCN